MRPVEDPFSGFERLQALHAADAKTYAEQLSWSHVACAVWLTTRAQPEASLAHFEAAVMVLRAAVDTYGLSELEHLSLQVHLQQWGEQLLRAEQPERALAAYDEALRRLDGRTWEQAAAEILSRAIVNSCRGFALEALGRHKEALAARTEAMMYFALTPNNEAEPEFSRATTAHMARYAEQSMRLIED